VADLNIYIMWPVLAVVWFGHRHKTRAQARAARDNMNDGI
jgi:hypothetical protein